VLWVRRVLGCNTQTSDLRGKEDRVTALYRSIGGGSEGTETQTGWGIERRLRREHPLPVSAGVSIINPALSERS